MQHQAARRNQQANKTAAARSPFLLLFPDLLHEQARASTRRTSNAASQSVSQSAHVCVPVVLLLGDRVLQQAHVAQAGQPRQRVNVLRCVCVWHKGREEEGRVGMLRAAEVDGGGRGGRAAHGALHTVRDTRGKAGRRP